MICIIHLHDQTYTHKQKIIICFHEIEIQTQKKNHVRDAWRIELAAQICK